MVLKRVFFGVLLCGIIGACGTPDMTDASTGELSGEKIYSFYCISCHGKSGDLKAGRAADLVQSTLSEEEIQSIIMFGSNKGMNAYKSLLSEEELSVLVTHVKSLQKN